VLRVLFDTSMLYIDHSAKRGIYYFTLNLLKYLNRYGNEVEIIRHPIIKYAGLRDIIEIPNNAVNLVKKISNLNADLIFIPHPRTFTHIVNLLIIPKPINIVIHDVHFLITHAATMYKLKLAPRYLCIRDIMKIRSDIIISTVSNFSKYAIERYMTIDPKRVFVIYPGIDEHFRPMNRVFAKQFIKEKYGIRNQYFIYTGAISKRKGVYDLIKAFLLINKKMNDYMLLLIGPPEDPDILRLVHEVGSIKYLGYVPRIDLPMLFSAATAFVFPSYHEGFGLPPLEAAACGVPIIVSKIPIFLETIGDAGIFVEPSNIEQLANAMNVVINDEDLRIKLSQKALNRAKMFSWKVTVKNYVRLWQEMTK
jgi:glycosyltransferase involved in cell wall biosynthesis